MVTARRATNRDFRIKLPSADGEGGEAGGEGRSKRRRQEEAEEETATAGEEEEVEEDEGQEQEVSPGRLAAVSGALLGAHAGRCAA